MSLARPKRTALSANNAILAISEIGKSSLLCQIEMLQRALKWALKVLAYVGSSNWLLGIVGLIQSKNSVNLIADAAISCRTV
jgi:hypothetical protein